MVNHYGWILKKLSTYRGFFYVPMFGLLAIIFYRELEDDFIVWTLGIGIIIAGFLIRLWATKHIGRRMPWLKRKGKTLVKTGPYAIVRNPLYIGNIIIAMGLSILSELAWSIPFVFIYFFTLYHFVAVYEENKLLDRWGDEYQVYMNEVPRWIPKFKNLHLNQTDGFPWKTALRSEIPSLLVIIFGISFFFLKEILSPLVE
jgi:protein-S-isoprenylcysteine O-methyltransferase Ste14